MTLVFLFLFDFLVYLVLDFVVENTIEERQFKCIQLCLNFGQNTLIRYLSFCSPKKKKDTFHFV